MKKLYIILIVILLVLSGCGSMGLNSSNEQITERQIIAKENEISSVEMIEDNQTNVETDDKNDDTVSGVTSNEYFYSGQDKILYDGYFEFIEVFHQDVSISYNQVAEKELYVIYEVVINNVENVPKDRLFLGYFCVCSDLIYRFDTMEEVNDYIDSGELSLQASILFKKTPVEDTLNNDEKGVHEYIVVNGDEVEYHSYNNLIETGYYETFIWKNGQGLIFYQSGFGAGRESIKLELMKK